MLTRRFAAVLAVGLTVSLAPVVPAHADSTAWARQLLTDLTSAWQVTKGRGVKVAVLSTGVDSSAAVVVGQKDLVGGANNHKAVGSLVAAIIAGSGPTPNSPFAIRGLASEANILSVRVYPEIGDPQGDNYFASNLARETLAQGIRYAADQGADVIMSDEYFWDNNSNDALAAAVAYALAKGSVVVAGNYSIPSDVSASLTYPAALPGVIGVAALGHDGTRAKDATTANSAVSVAAPGADGKFTAVWDTIAATCWVTATAALIRAEHPKMAPSLVLQALEQSAHHPAGGYNTEVGFGIINPEGALMAARTLAKQSPFAPATAGAVADRTRFGGPVPGDIVAVRHDPWLFAGFGGLIWAGWLALVGAIALTIRLRRRRRITAAEQPVTGWADEAFSPV
ncbi:MAG: hypothetical protein JWN00_1153 [Actinomycetia bacterium]|nr:hypothetical protein [Actinomycetes bacterium]